jgi:hypothetical protein
MARARETVARQEAVTVWDVQMHDAHNRLYVARWEDMPVQSETLRFRPESLPEWITEQLPDT